MSDGVGRPALEASVAAWRRTDLAGALREPDVGRTVVVCGWVHGRRDHGGIVFLDVRDRAGLVQVVCDPSARPDAHARASDLRLEYVIRGAGPRGDPPPRHPTPDPP